MKIMKIAQMITIAAIACSLNLNAQPKDTKHFELIPHAMITMPDGAEIHRAVAMAKIHSLKFEDWMLDQDYLKQTLLEVENWMIEAGYTQPETHDLEMESWMTDPDYLEDEAIPIESWMTDPSYLESRQG